MRFAIIGTGFGGLCAALKLRQAGHTDIVVYERAADIGGTWQVNTYPGAACDVPSQLYSFSFAQNAEWSRRFAPGPEILEYLKRVAAEQGLMECIRLRTEVRSARWTGTRWSLELADGSIDAADVLIPAVGQLSEPVVPPWARTSDFAGAQFHTARWRHDVDLTGKRVAVVGTGASAIQVIPAIAAEVSHMYVVQRTPAYVVFKPDSEYRERVGARRWHSAAFKRVARSAIWAGMELLTHSFTRYPATLRIIEWIHRRQLLRDISDPALRAALTPDYRLGCKRILMSNDYYQTLNRPNVDLVTDPVRGVSAEGLLTESDCLPVDVVVYATGFETDRFVSSVTVYGQEGVTLDEAWAEQAGAHLGLTVPGFPNMFLMYGPNTNLGAGSIVYMLECQADYIVSAAELAARRGPLEVDLAAYRRSLSEIALRQPRTVWAGCQNWYQDARGRDTHNWPYSMSVYRRRTRRAAAADFRAAPAAARAMGSK
ncbi:flavin-containing monooxygenase [Aldersonia kunmingensis]|uniref:flavin-containing monooxygenase n=1 Tax=Aldersonia kunmingensis TaxID=408066 RepID=UPI00082B0683|nr:NAD(P)/FAD-dependent oxidoreductase [Aldersonia kunmingensis]